MIPVALKTAIEEDEDFRMCLPLDYLDYMGLAHVDKVCSPITKWYTFYQFFLNGRKIPNAPSSWKKF